jgi:hypothetical protein
MWGKLAFPLPTVAAPFTATADNHPTGESHDQYQQVYDDQEPNKAKLSHEVLAGGAAFAGFKMFEDHQRAEGKPPRSGSAALRSRPKGKEVKHQFAKEVLVGLVGAEVDKLAETKGADWWDQHEVKQQAKQRAEDMYDDHYGGQDSYDPNNCQPHGRMQQQFGNNW